MIAINAENLGRRKMELRHTIRDGGEVDLTFRDRPYARVVPIERLRAERDELAALRRRVDELERQLQSSTDESVA